ncbi:MAG: type II secretion system F family protein [Acidobacteriota bacterium]
MLLAFAISVFVLMAVVIAAFGYRMVVKPAQFNERLDSMVAPIDPAPVQAGPQQKWLVRVVQTIGEQAPISPADASLARRILIAAGYRSERAVRVYYGWKIALAVVGLVVAVFAFGSIDNPVLRIIVFPAAVGGGFFVPNLMLDKLVAKRQERIRFALPDALDLMVVCMEAGLGLDQAIANVSRELKATHPDISEELGLVTLEMRAGKRRVEALKNLADRTGESELKKLVATMIQADRFGTSVGESLRTHGDFMRVKRRQEAEERAAKVGVKLVFPIFLFILPAMLVVAAGPGLLQLFKNLFPLMRGFGK